MEAIQSQPTSFSNWLPERSSMAPTLLSPLQVPIYDNFEFI